MASSSASDVLQRHARALSDPSRLRIFRYIAESAAPVTIAELTELLGFNHNAVRQHLAVLVEGDLILEEREIRDRPGRPRLLYSAREDALRSFGDSTRSYKRLAGLLLEVAKTGDSAYDVGRRSSRQEREEVDVSTSITTLLRQLAIGGFEPEKTGRSIVLHNCPFADVASDGPSVVCEIHRGLIDGHMEEGQNVELKLRDPHRGGCRVIPSSASVW